MTPESKHHKNLNRFFHKLTIKKITSFLRKQREEDGNIAFYNNGYLHSLDYLQQRFQIEQRRAERADYQFALVVIDWNHDQNRFQQATDEAALKEKKDVLFTTLKIILRLTDVVANSGDNRIVILLPDTDQAGSEAAIYRIKQFLNEISKPSTGAAFENLSIGSYIYPEQIDEINKLLNHSRKHNQGSALRRNKTIEDRRSSEWPVEIRCGIVKKASLRSESTNQLAPISSFVSSKGNRVGGSWKWQLSVKRYLDILISMVALIILSPLILLISLLVKITSPGPVFFKQERIGYKGQKFIIYKFRTMRQGQDEQIHKDYVQSFIQNSVRDGSIGDHGDPIFKITNDPRVTAIGKLLRRTSLDEIGQFFNVLKGEMSLIGPRPPIPYEVAMYDLWHKRRFLAVKPGITGLWQIYGRNTITFNEMVRLDLAYADNWSLALDLQILLKTIWAVVSMRGAY